MKLAPCQLHQTYGPKIRTAPPGYNWYQHLTFGFHDGNQFVTLPGRVQIRHRHKRTDVMTSDDKGACVSGCNIAWLIQQAGHELVKDDQYWESR
jgi:hypothetical protein